MLQGAHCHTQLRAELDPSCQKIYSLVRQKNATTAIWPLKNNSTAARFLSVQKNSCGIARFPCDSMAFLLVVCTSVCVHVYSYSRR